MSTEIWIVVCLLGWIVGALAALPITDGGLNHPWDIFAVFLWPFALLWAVATRGYRFASYLAPTEAARLRRRIRAVDHERKLLTLRAELEQKEAAYRAEFDRYVEGGIR